MKKVKAEKPSEMQLVERQAAKMLKDMERVQATNSKSRDQKTEKSSVDIFKDSDFYFSVVFQTSTQKYQFLQSFSKMFQLGIEEILSDDQVIQIINGMKLAKNLKIDLKQEGIKPYPYADLELAQLALDNEVF
jgi:hypothetical protein